MINSIKEFVVEELLHKKVGIEEISCILLNNSWYRKINCSRIECIVFVKGRPRFVARWYQDPFSKKDFSKEYEIQRLLSAKVGFRVPQPLKLTKINKRMVFFEEYLPGVPLERYVQKYHFHILSPQEAFNYAEQIQQDLDNLRITSSYKAFKEELEEIWSQFLLHIKPSLFFEVSLEIAKKHVLEFFEGKEVFKRLTSGDFICQNILINRESLGLVDFEFAEETHLYFLDWFRFVHYFPSPIDKDKIFVNNEWLKMALDSESDTSKALWCIFFVKDLLLKSTVFREELLTIEKSNLVRRIANLLIKNDEMWNFLYEEKILCEEKIRTLQEQIQSIYSSRTWRVGRIATAPWRWGRDLCYILREKLLSSVLREKAEKEGNSNHKDNANR